MFEEVFRKVLNEISYSHEIICGEDLYAWVGKQIHSKVVGMHGKENVNDNGESINICQKYSFNWYHYCYLEHFMSYKDGYMAQNGIPGSENHSFWDICKKLCAKPNFLLCPLHFQWYQKMSQEIFNLIHVFHNLAECDVSSVEIQPQYIIFNTDLYIFLDISVDIVMTNALKYYSIIFLDVSSQKSIINTRCGLSSAPLSGSYSATSSGAVLLLPR